MLMQSSRSVEEISRSVYPSEEPHTPSSTEKTNEHLSVLVVIGVLGRSHNP